MLRFAYNPYNNTTGKSITWVATISAANIAYFNLKTSEQKLPTEKPTIETIHIATMDSCIIMSNKIHKELNNRIQIDKILAFAFRAPENLESDQNHRKVD